MAAPVSNPQTWFNLSFLRDIYQTLFLHIRPENLRDALNKVPELQKQFQVPFTIQMYWQIWFLRDLQHPRKRENVCEFIGFLGFQEFIDLSYNNFQTCPGFNEDIFQVLIMCNRNDLIAQIIAKNARLKKTANEHYFYAAIRGGNVDCIRSNWLKVKQISNRCILSEAFHFLGRYHPQNNQLYQLLNNLERTDDSPLIPIVHFMFGLVEGNHIDVLKKVHSENLILFSDPDFDSHCYENGTLEDQLIQFAAQKNNDCMVQVLLSWNATHRFILNGIIISMQFYSKCGNILYFDPEHYRMFQQYMPYIKSTEWYDILDFALDSNNYQLIQHICDDLATLENCPLDYYLHLLQYLLENYGTEQYDTEQDIDNFILFYNMFKEKGLPINLRAMLHSDNVADDVKKHPKIIALLT